MADISKIKTLDGTTYDIKDATARLLILNIDSFSTLPLTIHNSNITSEHVVVCEEFGDPSVQIGTWTVTTSTGSVDISGQINGSTSLSLVLGKPISI